MTGAMAAPAAHPRPLDAGIGRFDKSALAIIGLAFLLLVTAWPKLVPAMSDTWYHLAIAQKTVDAGAVPLWDWWEFAPYGRPNLYPPLLHIILAGLASVLGSVDAAGSLLAATFLPLGLLTGWYCARKLLGPAPALLTVLLMLTDLTHLIVMQAYIAACLTNILMPLLLVAVIERRAWRAIGLMTLIYYSHLGFPHVVALGLVIFGIAERSYLRLAIKVVSIAFLFWTPWLAHVLAHVEWIEKVLRGGGLPAPLLLRVLSLQVLNGVIIVAGLIGARRLWRAGGAVRVIPCMMLGFLPILLSYGGRYMMHSLPLWCMAGAFAVSRLLPEGSSRLRLLLLSLATLLPMPAVGFFGRPMPLPFTTSLALFMIHQSGGPIAAGDKSERYEPDCDALAAWLRENTASDEVIFTNTEWIADCIARLADRRVDFGAWWECGRDDVRRENRAWRDDRPSATFVCIKPENDPGSIIRKTEPMPGVDETLEAGRFLIGLRRPHLLTDGEEIPLSSFRVVPAPGVAGEIKETDAGIAWVVAKGAGKLSAVEAPVPVGRFEGVEMRLRSDKPQPVLLGLETTDGRRLSAEVTVPHAGEWRVARVPLAWMRVVGSARPDELALAPLPAISRVVLSWAPEGELGDRRIEVHHVRLLHEGETARGLDAD